GFIGRLAAVIARVPAVIHQPHGHVFYGYHSPRRTAVCTERERQAARWTDRIITLTDRGAAEHLARGIGRAAQYAAVPSGVPTAELRAGAPARSEARVRLGLDPAAFVVVGLGRLVPIKGFDLLVRALPAVVDALAAALIELGRDDALRRKLGEAAEVRAESFSASVASEKLLAVYAALVRAKGLR